jgi:hypothetical protein
MFSHLGIAEKLSVAAETNQNEDIADQRIVSMKA